ncbi:STAS domain-containing protein [Blastococcus sp. CT_GayMR20]|uniref:STAS domain-containing protein n=1 Tax=Blastococcus sp. CT_GayMR20 TaxID=2559609 RepID=UPI00142FE2B5|nr:STAS domain-containing protein [Blastococcus sp. CT_GayMR20]
MTAVPSAGLGEHGMVRAHEWDVSRRLSRSPGGRRPRWGAHPPAPAVRVEWLSTGVRTVVAVSGDLDGVTTPQLEAVVAEQPLAGCAVLEVDLSGVPSIGSTGLSVLLGVRRWCQQRRIALRIRGTQPSVWRAFEATGLDRVFEAPAGAVETLPAREDPVLF